MRNFFVLLVLLTGSYAAKAQLGVKVYNYRPTGDFGFVFKPTFSVEAGLMHPFEKDERWRNFFTLTCAILKPRMESIPGTGVLSDGTGTHILPGKQSFTKYNVFQLSCGYDYSFINKTNYFVFAGLDITVGAATVEYTDDVETFKNETYQGGGVLGGFRGRLGAEYLLTDKISVMVYAQRDIWLITDPESINAANNYGIGLIYNFSN
ncbi:MAG TPA: hypothetical protein VLB84_02745 [Bacteroidia bacterium]|nr:hypothetical protein [Bacteroidia bacterium]